MRSLCEAVVLQNLPALPEQGVNDLDQSVNDSTDRHAKRRMQLSSPRPNIHLSLSGDPNITETKGVISPIQRQTVN